MAFDPLSPEVVYALKGNIAYPVVGATASVVANLAAARMQDAYVGSTISLAASDVTVVKQ